MAPSVFFITGCSSGFGAELVKQCISEGDKCIATSRNSSKLKFNGTSEDNFLAVDCDVTKQESIDAAFDAGLKQFQRIDVVINNAGYGLSGVFESLSERQIRMQMEINYFGLMKVTKKALEVMREKNSPPGGHIQQVTSIGGQIGVPSFSIYCGSKHAIEGYTEAISKEVKPEWNIKFTCIEPGPFRTEWAGGSMEFGEENAPAYDHIDSKKNMEKVNGTQKGDPARAAKLMCEVAKMESPPGRLVLGAGAFGIMQEKLKKEKEYLTEWEKAIKDTDFPEGQ